MKKETKKTIFIVVLILIISFILNTLIAFLIPYLSYKYAEIEINEDITKYNEYIGQSAKENYKNKWNMDESIFPNKIESTMNVIDYKMVYYNPWDAQYLSYLVVEYEENEYNQEINRLKNYNSTNYIGYYNVTGFTKYNLLAMYADSYQGFVYAITDNKNKIIYVELIFCNYFYDLDYKKYIDNNYLPNGFDASIDNSYMKKMLKESK